MGSEVLVLGRDSLVDDRPRPAGPSPAKYLSTIPLLARSAMCCSEGIT